MAAFGRSNQPGPLVLSRSCRRNFFSCLLPKGPEGSIGPKLFTSDSLDDSRFTLLLDLVLVAVVEIDGNEGKLDFLFPEVLDAVFGS